MQHEKAGTDPAIADIRACRSFLIILIEKFELVSLLALIRSL